MSIQMNDFANIFVKLAHCLISTPEPFMLTDVNVLGKNNVVCSCFYHSVIFTPHNIAVLTNEAGGMCPLEKDYLEKIYKIPNGFDYNKQKDLLLAALAQEKRKST